MAAYNAVLPAGLNNIYIQQFSENVHLLVEQKASITYPLFIKEIIRGKAEALPRMGVVNMSQRTGSSYGEVAFTEVGTDFRYMQLLTFDLSVPIAKIDIDRIGLDPTGFVTQRVASAVGREIDNVVINAMLGSASTGINGGGSPATIPSGQLIAVNFHGYDSQVGVETGSSNISLTVSKLLKHRQLILAAKRPLGLPDGDLVCLLSANQMAHLMADQLFVNFFYTDEKRLDSGTMGRYMDIEFHLSEYIPLDGDGNEQVIVFDKNALRIGIAPEGLKIEVQPRFDLVGYVNQVKAELDIGAVRMEEALVTVSSNIS